MVIALAHHSEGVTFDASSVSCRPFIVVPTKSLDWHRTVSGAAATFVPCRFNSWVNDGVHNRPGCDPSTASVLAESTQRLPDLPTSGCVTQSRSLSYPDSAADARGNETIGS